MVINLKAIVRIWYNIDLVTFYYTFATFSHKKAKAGRKSHRQMFFASPSKKNLESNESVIHDPFHKRNS